MKTREFSLIMGNHTAINPIKDDNIYKRKNICFKSFKVPYHLDSHMSEVRWSGEHNGFRENLIECTKIQNLLAFQGLAPRVYDLVFLKNGTYKYAAQVTDFIESPTKFEEREDVIKEVTEKIVNYCNLIGIKPHDIGDGANIRNGLFTDTQEFEFIDKYEEGLRERILTGLAYAGDTNIPYQSVEELGIYGRRVNKEREKLLQIPSELPKDFTVLDFGCNGAYFLRRAFDAGAVYGVGIDVSRVIEATRELNNYLGYFNIDFMTKVPDQEFDLVLLLSAFGYAKVEEIFPKAKMALIEGHTLNNQHTEEYYRKMLEPYYSKITTLGWTKDDPGLPPRVVMKGVR